MGLGQVAGGALVEDIERPDREDLVAQELDARGLGRAEGEEVQEPAPDGELSHLLHERDALEASLLERGHQGRERPLLALAERQPEPGQAVGHRSSLLERAERRDEEPGAPGEERFHRFHTESADLEVRLGGLVRKRFPLGIEGGGTLPEQDLQVGLGRSRAGWVGRDQHEHAAGCPVERRH